MKQNKKYFLLDLLHFFGVLLLAIYTEWKPHQLYLGFCLEIFFLVTSGIIHALVLLIRIPSQRVNFPWAFLLLSIFFLWLVFVFSFVTGGIAKLDSNVHDFKEDQFLLFTEMKEYWVWILLNFLLTFKLVDSAKDHIEKIFVSTFFTILRLFPSAFIALLLAALPIPLTLKIFLFSILLLFPHSSFYYILKE
jgi:hypothetical protein